MMIDDRITDSVLLFEIGARLRHIRIQQHIKQSELAQSCGLSRSAIIRLENGEGGVTMQTFLSVLRKLGLLRSLDAVLPEISITPAEQVQMDKQKRQFPKIVRSRRKTTPARKWGDEMK